MYDLISIGDTVVDTFVTLEDAEIIERNGQPKLVLEFGAKVPVGPSVSFVGGNAANNAVGSSRLKLKTAIYTNVGNKDDDEADDRIKAKLKKEGVDTRYIAESWELQSNHHIVLDYKGDRTILIHHQPWKFNLPDLDKTRWVYLTSMSPSFVDSNIIDQIINYIERSGAKLAYQPGTFQIKLGAKKSARLLSLSEFLVLNLEEAARFLGRNEATANVKKLLKEIADTGVRNVVITDGKEGSYGFDGEKIYKLGLFPGDRIEVTGAGDAFATGTLAGLFYGEYLPSAMRWGAANATSVVGQIGPQAGLLTLNKMRERLKEHPKIIAKEI